MNNLSFIRQIKGYTQKKLSEILPISLSTITYLERININHISENKKKELQLILEFLDIDINDLEKEKEYLFFKYYKTKKYQEGIFKTKTILDKYKILDYKKKHNLKGDIKKTGDTFLITGHKIYNVKNKKYVVGKWNEIEL